LDKLQALNLGRFLEKWGVESSQSQQVLQNALATGLQDLSKILLGKMDYVFTHLAEFILESAFAAVALFFFFRDGAHYSIKVIELLPLEKEHREKVARTFSKTVTAVVRAIFLTALIQGFLSGVGFVVTGVPLPIFWGVVAFINSFIPFLGAASVWIPASIWLFYQNQVFAAVALASWGILISIMDHILRPWLIGSEAKLPIFWLFFTTIGGLKVYGILGIFLGPIILSMGIAFLAIYREVYLNLKKTPATKNPLKSARN
jgi:predicted PurR-regulated permease PerM